MRPGQPRSNFVLKWQPWLDRDGVVAFGRDLVRHGGGRAGLARRVRRVETVEALSGAADKKWLPGSGTDRYGTGAARRNAKWQGSRGEYAKARRGESGFALKWQAWPGGVATPPFFTPSSITDRNRG